MFNDVENRLNVSLDPSRAADPGGLLGQIASLLIVASGVMSVTIAELRQDNLGSVAAILVLALLVAVCATVLVWKMFWRRWLTTDSHSIAVVSLGIVFSAWIAGGSLGSTFFYVALSAWIGLRYKRTTVLRFLPLLALAYALPLVLRGESLGMFAAPLVYTLALCLTVGGIIAWLSEKLSRLEDEVAGHSAAEHFGPLIEHLSDIIAVVDDDGRLRFVNPSVRLILGYPPDQIIGTSVLNLIHPDDSPRFEILIQRLLGSDSGPVSGEFRFRHCDGGFHDLDVLGINQVGNEHVQGLLFTARDITDRKATEMRLLQAEERYRSLIEQLPAMTYIEELSASRSLWIKPWVSPQSEEMFGYSPEDWAWGINFAEEFVHPDDLVRVQDQHMVSAETFEPFDSEYRVITRHGRVIWVRDYAQLLRNDAGEPLHWQGIMFDISAQKQLELRLEHLALYDQLTGLPNRALLVREMELNTDVFGSMREGAAVLFFDIDNLKLINDSIGHTGGDQIIAIVARRLQQVVGRDDTIARFGGDEFVVMLTGPNALFISNEIARRMIQTLKTPVRISGHEITVTASIGIAATRPGNQTPEDLLRDADIAMLAAKSQGRNQWVRFDESMQGRAIGRLVLESELSRAIDEHQFEVHFQPIVDLRTRRVTKLEALLRWRHPTRGLLMPDDFIGVAEETGHILTIGHIVIEEACRQAKRWQDIVGAEVSPSVCVNLSPVQFLQPALADEIQRIVEDSGVSPERLELEITESATMRSPEIAVETLRNLKALNVSIALDDFGTGYSGLSYLTRFPIDTLKIDRSFVAGMHDSPQDLAIVRTILAFADSLGLKTIAEGVELSSQRKQLIDLGCNYGQGYYFSHPIPADDIPALLETRTSIVPTPSPLPFPTSRIAAS